MQSHLVTILRRLVATPLLEHSSYFPEYALQSLESRVSELGDHINTDIRYSPTRTS